MSRVQLQHDDAIDDDELAYATRNTRRRAVSSLRRLCSGRDFETQNDIAKRLTASTVALMHVR